MSERIKELDKQAKLWAMDNTNFPISSHIPAGYTEKFAELIVQECMKLCIEVKEDLSTIKDDDRRDLAEMSANFCYEAIKSEFGVEE